MRHCKQWNRGGQISISKVKDIHLPEWETAVAEVVPEGAKYIIWKQFQGCQRAPQSYWCWLSAHMMKDRVGPGKPGLIPSFFHCQKQERKYAQRSMKSSVSHVSQPYLLITSEQSLKARVCQDSIKVLSLPINCTMGTYTGFGDYSNRLEQNSTLLALYIYSQATFFRPLFSGLLRTQTPLYFNFTLCAACLYQP